MSDFPTELSEQQILNNVYDKTNRVLGTSSSSSTITSVTPGTGASNLGKAEDAAHTTGDVGVMALAVRQDSESALAGTSGDYIPLATDSTGKLRTNTAGSVAHDAVDAGNPVKIGGKASTTLPTSVANADRVDAYFDANGRQVTTLSASSNATSTAYEASRLVKASAGLVFGVSGYNSKASAQFIQLHNASSVPADTAVPAVVMAVPASSNFSIDFGTRGRSFSTGIAICNSSTGPTKTIGSADCWFDVQYE